jgi:hypothetical protein
VPQKTYRPDGNIEVRVKRCGKSAPPSQQCGGRGKPHTEQDQIGREPEVSALGACRLGASQPPGRSLEPRSNVRPRGMTVPPEQSGGQNSAYRSGCHKLLFSITYRNTVSRCDAGVTQLSRIGRKFGPRLPENRLAHETGKRTDRTPLQAKLPERCTETLDQSLSGKNDATFA